MLFDTWLITSAVTGMQDDSCLLTVNLNRVGVYVRIFQIRLVRTDVVVSSVRHQQIVDYHRREVVTEAAPFIIGSGDTIIVCDGERVIELQFNFNWFARCLNTGRLTTRQSHALTGFHSVGVVVSVRPGATSAEKH